MAEEHARDELLRSLDRIRAMAGRIENELTELQNIVRFDHRSEGAPARGRAIETELVRLAAAVHELGERFEGSQAAAPGEGR